MKNKAIINIGILLTFLAVPFVSLAQNPAWLNSLITEIGAIMPRILAVLIGLAVVLFIWGLIKFIAQSGDENAVAEGKMIMFWGVIAIFVIVSVWGLVALLQQIVGTNNTTPTPPQTTYNEGYENFQN